MLSGIVFGFESWTMFWNNVRPYMTSIMEAEWHGLFYQRLMVRGSAGRGPEKPR